jgi:demethoxyubiquinone hydroxylase (CLK1/Coq7/Cat5 family)
MTDIQAKNVDQLNSFLRGEISAVETYRQALEALADSTHTSTILECKRSHEERVAILSDEIRRLGGDPVTSSGAWGSFAKLVQGSASVLGEKTAIAALEEGEDHGNEDYERDVSKLEPTVRAVIEQKVVPLQLRTHASMSALKKRVA